MRDAHREKKYLKIVPIEDGKAETGSETHSVDEDGLLTTREETLLKTRIGRLAPPHKVSECQGCGDWEIEIKQCSVCGRVLCPICARSDKNQVFCPEHWAFYVENRSTWR